MAATVPARTQFTSAVVQVPQFLLDASIEAGLGGGCSIICTQPRRIAAISVAERVCQEREDSAPGALQTSLLICDAFSCSASAIGH